MDYKSLGFKCGLEIHQQLDTGKLFCACPSHLVDEAPDHVIERKLRAVAGELGEIDPAAVQAALRGSHYKYEVHDAVNCLVELDEEPPHAVNSDALETVLIAAQMLNCDIFDELHVMRKTVIDGSNVSGFQRTSLVAMNGSLSVGNAKILSVCLEEDAARKLEDKDGVVTYNLDRLGVPLIEIATDPSIKTPEDAKKVAKALGGILRATKKVKRGIGTIRQDVNISIKDGARVEVKGVQDLNILSKVIENEVKRQVSFLELRDELKKRGAKKPKSSVDVTSLFKSSKSKVIQSALSAGGSGEADGGAVYALALPGFAGLLGKEVMPDRRVGTELADYAKSYGSKGLFHSDELPNYGITEEDVAALRKKLKLSEKDGFILIAEQRDVCEKCMDAVIARVNATFVGLVEETRRALPDGTSQYLRPLPGGARMYPETDLVPIVLSKSYLAELKAKQPQLPWEQIAALEKKYNLSKEIADELYSSMYLELFEQIVNSTEDLKKDSKKSIVDSKTSIIDPKLVAVTFTNHIKQLDDPQILQEQHFIDLFKAFSQNKFSKEAIPKILEQWAADPSKQLDVVLSKTGSESISDAELEKVIKDVVKKNAKLIESKGESVVSALMGDVMREVRGKADGGKVMQLLRKSITAA